MSSRLCVDPTAADVLQGAGITSVGHVLGYRPSSLAALSGSSETFPVDLPGGAGRVFVKRYRYRRLRAQWEGLFRGTLFGASRARFEYEFLDEMRRRGVPAVEPMAYGEKRKRGWLRACFLITAAADETESIDSLLLAADIDAAERRALARHLGAQIRRMHDAGVLHGGLFGRNIMVGRDATADRDGRAWRFCLLDPDRRGRFYSGSVPPEGVVSDLSDLAATAVHLVGRTDFLRFARGYWDCRRLSEKEKATMRQVAQASRGKAKQEGHRLAVGSTISWLAGRIERTRADTDVVARPFDSVDDFFQSLSGGPLPAGLAQHRGTVRLQLSGNSGSTGSAYTMVVDRDTIQVHRADAQRRTAAAKPDLSVHTSQRTWLAILNAHEKTFEWLRTDGFDIRGDTRLLMTLQRIVDARTAHLVVP
ncbi:MAG: lipopolysaccharide kinase InaA family protein [Phycisphaerae bacterium]